MNRGRSTGWFKCWGSVDRPVHPAGILVMLAALAFLLQVFLALEARAHSVSDLLHGFYVYAVPTFLGLMGIGERTSGDQGGSA